MANRTKCNFTYHAPQTLTEALKILDTYMEQARISAGGTDVVPKLKAGVLQFSHFVSLKNLNELRGVCYNEQTGLTIGAMATLKEVEAMAEVQTHYPALYTGIHSMANTQIRNRGTVSGNICNAVPSADTAPALLVYDARVNIASSLGMRSVPIAEFFTGVCKTVLAPNEIVVSITLPVPVPEATSVYYKYTIRNALDLAMVGVAAYVEMDGKLVKDIRLGLGAVAITPKRAAKAEALLQGQELTEERIAQAALLASQEDCAPISDIRATADYRREMVRIHVRDALRLAAK